MSYRRRASPLHAARAGAGCAYCVALALRRAAARPTRSRWAAVVVAIVARRGRRRRGPRDAARGAVRGAAGARDRAHQRARHARRADRDRAPRATCPCSGTPTSRSRRRCTAPILGPARGRADPVRRAVHRGGRSRRGAAAVPARLVSLGADGDARDAHGAGARRATRGGSPTRSAAGPGRRRRAWRWCARRPRACSTARSTSRRRSRCAGTAPPGAPPRRAQAVVAPRPRVRRVGRGGAGAGASRRGSPGSRRSRPTRRCTRRRGPSALVAVALASSSARCCRSPTGGGSSDDACSSSSGVTYSLSGRAARRRSTTSSLDDRAGRARRARGRVGLGQVDAAAGRQRARAALSRRRRSPGA